MRKPPPSPESIFAEYTRDWQTAYGKELLSIVAYGSVARGEYRVGSSDINFLVLLTEAGIKTLRPAIELIEKWRPAHVAVPLLMTRAYIERSLDTFPIEFLGMRLHHQMVFGEDVLADLSITKADLRLQIEREVKGKLLHLRENFLDLGNDRNGLWRLLQQSLPAFTALFEALLYLRGQAIPAARREVIAAGAGVAGLDRGLFDKLLNVANQESRPYRVELLELFERYISQIRELAGFVDGMEKAVSQ